MKGIGNNENLSHLKSMLIEGGRFLVLNEKREEIIGDMRS